MVPNRSLDSAGQASDDFRAAGAKQFGKQKRHHERQKRMEEEDQQNGFKESHTGDRQERPLRPEGGPQDLGDIALVHSVEHAGSKQRPKPWTPESKHQPRQKDAMQQVKRKNHQHSPNGPKRKHGGPRRHFHEDNREHPDEDPEGKLASIGG